MGLVSTSWKPGESGRPSDKTDNFSLRRQLRRRFEKGYDPDGDGESDLSRIALDQFEKAMREGDPKLLELARKVIEELDGPQRQAIDHAVTYSIVEIVGEDVSDEPTGGGEMP